MSASRPRFLRVIIGIVAGVAAGWVTGAAWGLGAGIVAGWGAAAAALAAAVLIAVWRLDGPATRTHATREDPGRALTRAISVIGSVVSLGAVAFVLIEARRHTGVESFVLAGIAVLSVVASWLLIQTDYMLHLARMYYATPAGGIDFNQDEDPQYTDFAYMSFGIGMTYQVADTGIRTNEIRRVVIAQTLLAYLFGAVILATVINLVTSLG